MTKRLAILFLAALGAAAAQAEIRWSASGIVGRDGRPWNGEVQLYKASVGMMTKWSSFMDAFLRPHRRERRSPDTAFRNPF